MTKINYLADSPFSSPWRFLININFVFYVIKEPSVKFPHTKTAFIIFFKMKFSGILITYLEIFTNHSHLQLQLGIAVGFVVPPMLVLNHDDIALIGRDLQFMFYLVAGVSTVLLILVVLCKYLPQFSSHKQELHIFIRHFSFQSFKKNHQRHLHQQPRVLCNRAMNLPRSCTR